ncbi:MAG: Rnase Y domain-containing protein, partial [Chloroflexota bacterium]
MPALDLVVVITFALAIFIIGVVAGGLATFLVRRVLIGRQMRIAERRAARTIIEARNEGKTIVQEGKQEIEKSRAAAENEARQRRAELQRQENRLSQKSDSFDRKLENVENRERNLLNKEKEIDSVRAGV